MEKSKKILFLIINSKKENTLCNYMDLQQQEVLKMELNLMELILKEVK